MKTLRFALVAVALFAGMAASSAFAGQVPETFTLVPDFPPMSKTPVADVLGDGRFILYDGDTVYIEVTANSLDFVPVAGGYLGADPIECNALVPQHVSDAGGFVTKQGQKQVLGFDLPGPQSVGGVDGENQRVPENGRTEGLGQLLLVYPLELAVARVGEVVIGTDARAEHGQYLLTELVDLKALLAQDLGGYAVAIGEKGEDEMLGADVAVSELASFLDGAGDDLLGTGRLGAAPNPAGSITFLHARGHLATDLVEINVEEVEGFGSDAVSLGNESEHNVGGGEVVVLEPSGFEVGEGHGVTGPVGKPFAHL